MPFELADFDFYGTPPATAAVPEPNPTPKMGVATVTPDSGHYASCYLCLAAANVPIQHIEQFVVRRYREYIDRVTYGPTYPKTRSYVITLCHRCDLLYPGPRAYSENLKMT